MRAVNHKERAGRVCGHVGIWHETDVVTEGAYESIYADLPAFGLAAAHGRAPVERRGALREGPVRVRVGG